MGSKDTPIPATCHIKPATPASVFDSCLERNRYIFWGKAYTHHLQAAVDEIHVCWRYVCLLAADNKGPHDGDDEIHQV